MRVLIIAIMLYMIFFILPPLVEEWGIQIVGKLKRKRASHETDP